MRYFFPFVTSDFSTAKPGLLQEIIQKDACAAAFLAVHVAQSNQLLYAPYPERVIFRNHQALRPLHAPYKLHPTFWYVLSNVCQVVRAAGFIQKVHTAKVGFGAFDSHNPAHATYM